VYIGFWWGKLRVRAHFEDLGIDEKIILRWIFRKWYVGMEWNELAQDSERWRALVNAVMNFRVP